MTKFATLPLTLLCIAALVTPHYAQDHLLTGTWRIDGSGNSLPWTMILRVDGEKLSGTVSSCASPRVAIYDGHVEGRRFTFKCTSLDGDRTTTFSGTLSGDRITMNRETVIREGGNRPAANNAMFGPAAPTTFEVRRVPPDELDESDVFGNELDASVNLASKDVKAQGKLFVPQDVRRIRAVLVTIQYGLGSWLYDDPQVRRMLVSTQSAVLLIAVNNIGPSAQPVMRSADEGGAEALVTLLERLADELHQPGLKQIPLVFWGHSAAANFGTLFAVAHLERTLAVVRYHLGGGTADADDVKRVPTLFFLEGTSSAADVQQVTDSLRKGRAAGAPWTLAIEPYAKHGEPSDLKKANALLIPWMTAVLRQRISPKGDLRMIEEDRAWLGNQQTLEASPFSAFNGPKAAASWLPDEDSAHGWQRVTKGDSVK